MLRSDGLACEFLDCLFGAVEVVSISTQQQKREQDIHITQRNHTDGLPDTKSDTGSDTTIQTLQAVVAVDVVERLPDSQVLRSIGIGRLALHLHSNDLDRLIPGR